MNGLRLIPACLAAFTLAFGPGAGSAEARGAADYFHGGAHKYVAGRHQEAMVQVEEGLRKFPNDAALKGLAAQLRRLKDQQNKDQGSEGSSEGQEGDDKKDKQDGSSGKDEGKDEEKKDQEKAKEKAEDKGKEGEEKGKAGESEGEDGKDSTGEAMAPVKPGEMSKEDAERLLNSVQDDEKKEHKQMQRRHRKKVEVEQDW